MLPTMVMSHHQKTRRWANRKMKAMHFRTVFTKIVALTVITLLCSCGTSNPGTAMQQKISGSTYVIAGASSGLGRGVAEELGRYHANVVLAARRTDILNEIAAIIKSNGGNAHVVTTDVSQLKDVENLAAEAIKTYGKVDVWINMAGVGAVGQAWKIPAEDQARVIDVNIKGVIYGSREAVDIFRKQGKGVLVNIGSIDSEVPNAYQAAYSSSKAAVRSYSLALGQELRLDNAKDIKVVVIEPWAVDTPFWIHSANYTGKMPKFAAMDEPPKVVNAIIRKSVRPKKIVPVGWKAKGVSFFANVCPRCIEKITGNIAHRYKMELPPEAADTKGSLYVPMKEGDAIEGGVNETMKQAKKDQKTKQ
jgi:short-subunit dehydrogenase